MNITRYTVTNSTRDNVSYHNSSNIPSTSVSLLEGSITLESFIFILSISAVLVNLITVWVIFTTPQLKRHSTMFLAGHIAICDFLIGLYLLVVAINTAVLANKFEQRSGYLDSWKRYICPFIISIRSVALLVEPVVLFVMTLDRYRRIVNHSKPPLSQKVIAIAAYVAWFVGIVLVGINSVSFMGKEHFNGTLCSRVDSTSKSMDFYIEKALITTSSLLFASCCVMYFRIYRVVKTQNLRTGTQTYVRVSKLLFALVLSTLVLWFVPAMAVAFVGRQNSSSKEIRQLTILISFATNSLVNPFLYVFRENKFQHVIFPWRNRTSRRIGTPGQRINSLRVNVIAMDVVKDEQNPPNCDNSDETQKECTTSL